MSQLTQKHIPQHVAIVMDGNGRWARQRNMPRMAGHKAGVDALREVIQACQHHKIKILTVFAFSSENWYRPDGEVRGLMDLFFTSLGREIKKLHKNNIKFTIIGDLSRFSEKLQKRIQDAMHLTRFNTSSQFVLAVNYGGQWDIVNSTKQLAAQVQSGKIQPEDIDKTLFAKHLSTGDLPEPDLFIRTSGEQRISNFLLWQLAYTELYFTNTLWPDFKTEEFNKAISHYQQRQRRFGKVAEQVESTTV